MKQQRMLLMFAFIGITIVGFFIASQREFMAKYNGLGISYAGTVIIALTGFLAWRVYSTKWPVKIWVFTYLVSFCLLLIIACIHKYFTFFPI